VESDLLLEAYLRQLHLTHFLKYYRPFAADAARSNQDHVRYLLARAIQFFLPGIPQVYYVGLLAGRNDLDLLARTRVGRDINRRHYTRGEIDEALQRPVVADLCELIRMRNSHPAFAGEFELVDTPDESLEMRWTAGDAVATLRVDLHSGAHCIELQGTEQPQFQLLKATVIA